MKFLQSFQIIVIIILFINPIFLKRNHLNKNSNENSNKCNVGPIITIEDKKIILNLHNEFRNQVATKNINIESEVDLNQYFPYANNMYQMYWDNALANEAQSWAEKCIPSHSKFNDRVLDKFKSSENIFFKKYKSGFPEKPDFTKVIKFWFSKITKFRAMKKSIFSYDFKGVNIDSFAQIIWAKTYRIGCGYSQFKHKPNNINYEMYVCLYGPNGLNEGQSIYESSSKKECKCPASTSCGNPIFPGLCCPSGLCTKESLYYESQIPLP